MSVIAVRLDRNTPPPKKNGRVISLIVTTVLLVGIFLGFREFQASRLEADIANAVAPLVDYREIYETGSDREANDLLLKTVALLLEADSHGVDLDTVFSRCAARNSTPDNYAEILAENLKRNLKIARQLGCDTPANVARMNSGRSPTITNGPYAGEKAEVDHIVPRSLAPDLDNLLINLELLPRTLNRKKSNRVTARAFAFAEKFLAAGVIDPDSFATVAGARE